MQSLNESVLTFRGRHLICAKFHQNQTKIATKGVHDDGQKKASDFIICYTLRYSNGRDQKISTIVISTLKQQA